MRPEGKGVFNVEITQVRVFPVNEEKLKAFASIIIDDCFVVSDIKIIQGNSGLFISMPSKKRKNGMFRDIAHPLNSETRKLIEDQIIDKYREVLAESGEALPGELRALRDPSHDGLEDAGYDPREEGSAPWP